MKGLHSMDNLLIGHHTDEANGTGVSVFLFEKGAIGAYLICGSAPASHELAVLDPANSVPHLHGLLFAGGSAFGLSAVQGVMQYLAEKQIGHATLAGPVPIVPSACIYDLAYRNPVPPTADQAYAASQQAIADNPARGPIGVGRGARVGKIVPHAEPMQGGVGIAELRLDQGIVVRAYVVVNAIGDVYNDAGQIIAGARANGAFVNATAFLLAGNMERQSSLAHSTLAAVFTNAKFTKDELLRISKMAIAGIARSVSPVFTRYDGDILFSISIGDKSASELTIGTMAAEAVRLAILDAFDQ